MKYLSHESALQYWKFTLAHQYFAKLLSQCTRRKFLVLNERDRVRNSREVSFTFTKELPPNALDHEHRVVSPYLMFMQMAKLLSLTELIILGCLMCACVDGPYSNPIILKRDLVEFVEAAVHYPGRKKALQALQYVEECAMSIMEVFVYLLLRLPNHMGGLGIKGGIFNYKIELQSEDRHALRKQDLFVDLYFPDEKIGFEYMGGHHKRTMEQDYLRGSILKRMGNRMHNITKIQLYDSKNLAGLIRDITKDFGKNNNIRAPKYEIKQKQLLAQLPRYDGDSRSQ